MVRFTKRGLNGDWGSKVWEFDKKVAQVGMVLDLHDNGLGHGHIGIGGIP